MTNSVEKAEPAETNPTQHKFVDTINHFIHSLSFDDTAKQVAALKALIFNAQETNQTKIQFIKEELLAGSYQIYSEHIAAKLTEYVPSIAEVEPA